MVSRAMGALESGPRFFDFTDNEGEFDPKHLRGFIQYDLRRSIQEFAHSQIDERLAQMMRDTITSGVAVSEAELWDEYVREQEKAVLKYVRFSPQYFRTSSPPSREKIDEWIQANQERIEKVYEKQRDRYTGLPKQVRARHILIKVAQDADEPSAEKARLQAEELAKQARGGADFALLAREHSQDTGSARNGGDLGYNPKGKMVEEFDEAQFSLEPGEVSDPVRTRHGFHVIKVEAVREGDVPEQEAKQEIGEKLMLEQYGRELAAQSAEQALARLKQGVSMDEFAAELSGTAPAVEEEEKSEEQKSEEQTDAAAAGEAGEEKPAIDPLAPRVQETRPFSRVEMPVAGPFDSAPLIKSAFELSEEQPLPDAPLRLGEDWFVYRLQSRTRADRDGFTEVMKEEISRVLLYVKRRDALAEYVSRLKKQARAKNALHLRAVAQQKQTGLQQ
jgi:hypothetical protein